MTTRSGTGKRRTRLLWLVPAQAVGMVALGLFVTGVPAGHRLLATEDRVTDAFAARRTPWAGSLSEWLSVVASTEGVVGVTLVGVICLLVLPRTPRWVDAVFLGASVAAQSAVFLVVTMCVDRPRPDVPRLDGAPPTSSFPSGHVGASVALYGGLATLVWTRVRGPWRYVAAALLVLVPPVVGLSRMYRGMHHPSDVAGGLANGVATLLVMGSVFLPTRTRTRTRTRLAAPVVGAGGDECGWSRLHPCRARRARGQRRRRRLAPRARRGHGHDTTFVFEGWRADIGRRRTTLGEGLEPEISRGEPEPPPGTSGRPAPTDGPTA